MPRYRTSRSSRRAARAPVAALALLVALPAAGCRSLDASVHNLRELHFADGSARPEARLMTGLQYGLSSLVGGRPTVTTDDDGVQRVSRPQARALADLNRLARYRGERRSLVAAQVDLAAFLALDSDSQVVRERAVRLLAELADRLEVQGVALEPNAGSADRAALLDAADRLVDGATEAQLTAFVAAVDALQPDLEGARLLVRRLGELRGVPSARRAASGLDRTEADLRRRCVELALGGALSDRSDWVRAAATEAAIALQPELTFQFLEGALRSGSMRQLEVLLRHVADSGPDLAQADREAWVDGAAEALDRGSLALDGPVVVAACDVLAALSDVQLETLRVEEWLMWFDERRAPATDAGAAGGSGQ